MKAHENPFRVQRTEALPFRTQDGLSGEALAARWLAERRRGAVVGPRGTGKTTLLRTVARVAARKGFEVRQLQLGRAGLRVRGDVRSLFTSPPHAGQVVLVDGAGCLPWPVLWRAALRCRGARCTLFTTHLRSGLPTLLRTDSDPALLASLLEQLGPEAEVWAPHAERLLRRHRGDVRKVLRALYDQAASADDGGPQRPG